MVINLNYYCFSISQMICLILMEIITLAIILNNNYLEYLNKHLMN